MKKAKYNDMREIVDQHTSGENADQLYTRLEKHMEDQIRKTIEYVMKEKESQTGQFIEVMNTNFDNLIRAINDMNQRSNPGAKTDQLTQSNLIR